MNVTFPIGNIDDFVALLRLTEATLNRAVKSPPAELVAVKSAAGGYVLRRQPVNVQEAYPLTLD